ncbi:3-dehydro-L-gulonate 2-dehydrogenase [Tunturiibacter gelidoferens]|uniref:3-dehydro-L-gulonate 2-dehydrogenase n=2 Tax=Tunturiibacter TaxID=3154218 RepID=A0A7Y9T3R3_9BACT|nr:3-dehydro-L-gulonate 2-dehydrogenase [Edaphobacter lichenicola]MBB5338068.1 3-dehydro-L-gulonate 2-dehydrogenase [Edaphobacter lichenicola]NYF52676.1 3-dehydro-L-gulonate 2-dehydrogenase [Edaphobacter lichenicola]
MLRVPFDELHAALRRAMQQLGLTEDRAALCARLFAETTRDGVYTHGLNRFPRFVETIRNGSIHIHAEPTKTTGIGAIERWEGHRGVGNLNAHASMQRAITLAKQHGIGAVALANTNHWMRGGTYGWQAAEQGLFALCWTNTLANLPAWGATTPTLGNNPFVIAVPRPGGHVVLDMAMSQFSYGTLAAYSKRGQPLPVDGGFDTAGNLTRDPAAIESSQRALPVGYWKGSGLSLVLDMLAAMISGGLATHQIPRDPLRESGLSQVFLAIDPTTIADPQELSQIADAILDSLHQATPADPGKPIRYPGQQTLQLREENLRLGVPVDPEIWHQLNPFQLS